MLFLDSSYLIALFFDNDKNNLKATELSNIIENEGVLINNTVLSEVLNSFSKYNITNVKSSINNLFNNPIDYLVDEDYEKALEYYEYYNLAINYNDCTILVSMEKESITGIVSFDSDFDKINGINRIYL